MSTPALTQVNSGSTSTEVALTPRRIWVADNPTSADGSKTGAAVASQPVPRTTRLPLGTEATTFTREQMTILYHCSHGELGRLLVRRMAPLPIRVDGQILWFVDEARNAQAQVARTLERWRHR